MCQPQRGAKDYMNLIFCCYGDKVCLTYFISILYSKFDNQVKIIILTLAAFQMANW